MEQGKMQRSSSTRIHQWIYHKQQWAGSPSPAIMMCVRNMLQKVMVLLLMKQMMSNMQEHQECKSGGHRQDKRERDLVMHERVEVLVDVAEQRKQVAVAVAVQPQAVQPQAVLVAVQQEPMQQQAVAGQ